ncbi:SDR family oxidoreductase [Halobacteriovorax sp.]|uniref:SDR family oxidoreductase n=1 Tax=Halobacteriovorax sp. TaxID=2020862 RepID=UPI0035613F19
MKRTAIVTGSSRGIGKAIALRLAKDGLNVVVNYSSNLEAAQEVVNEIKEYGANGIAVKADVSKMNEVLSLFDTAESEFGRVDVLVNNAGIMSLSTISDFTEDKFDQILAVNLKGTFNSLQCAATRLKKDGAIINLTSSAIALGIPGYAVYNASKAAVESMSYTYARELRGKNITVNCVAPGPTSTDLFLTGKTEEQIENFKKMSPLERLGRPEDIAGVVSFFTSSDSSWVNGQVLRANGGIV